VEAVERRLSPEQQRLFAGFRFLAVFTVLAGPFYLVLASGWDATGIRAMTATVSAAVLNAAGVEVTSSGSFVHGSAMVLDVTRDSTGWKSVLVFTALVLATGRSLRATVRGLATGVVVLFVANVLRITTMFYAVTVYGMSYELLHTVLWRWGLTAVVLVTWLGWITEKPVQRTRYLVRTVFLDRSV
jgi:exosortase/archaeosortase family protein